MYPTLILALAVTAGAPAPKETPKKKEGPSIVGTWSLERGESGGMVIPLPPGGNELSLTFNDDGTLVAHKGGKGPDENGKFSHDPKKSPAEIDLTESRPGGKDMMIRGIYKIDGETLTICMAPLGERPTKIESPAGAQTIIMTLKRVKKD